MEGVDDWKPPKPDDPDDMVAWAHTWLDEDEVVELWLGDDDPAFSEAIDRWLAEPDELPSDKPPFLWWPPEATERLGVDMNFLNEPA
jgi:hypothetical protein